MVKKEEKKEKIHLETITDKVGEVAVHYGFTVIKPPHVSGDDISKAKHFKEYDLYEDAVEKIALTRWYIENRLDLEVQPVLLHYKKPLPGSSLRKKPSVDVYGFEIMGSYKSTSEALLIKCAIAVLEEAGYSSLCVDINSIGDRESVGRFEREIQSYTRKNGNSLSAKARQELKRNHFSFLANPEEEAKEFLKNFPQPISSLSDVSRLHFKEVLESVEAFNVTYKIKPSILSNKLYAAYTVMEIRDISKNEEGELLAYGYRYNHLAKKLGAKREIPTVGLTIMVKKNPKMAKKVMVKKIRKPHFYLAQLGNLAKIKALNIVEMLRKERIPVGHSITKDKITGQLTGAEFMKATHVLVMGQKEAIENSMIVRSLINREQETVSIGQLSEFLKKIEKPKR